MTQSTIPSARSSAEPANLAPGAMPDTRALNFYDTDPYLRFLLARRLPAHERKAGEPLLRELGALVGTVIEDLAAEADRQTPTLRTHNRRGERADEILPSHAYRELEALLYGRFGLAAMALRPGVCGLDRPASLVLNDALVYLAEQAESGLFCPLSMTRALARTLVKYAPAELTERYLPHLTATDVASLYTGAMFMTEKQGGTDLGITSTRAQPAAEHPGLWELDGEKWFCSNAGADLILTLARPDGAPDGTRGLGLFLVPRVLPDGRRNAYRIERLKDKLGVRSFASGEVTFTRTLAYLIGGSGQGWRQMTEMLNVTRLGCAGAAAALARRSFLEALTHARGRVAFGKPLADLPLMREQLLDLLLGVEALTALFFEGSAQLQAADEGDESARVLVRILIPLAKFHASDVARRLVTAGMEVRGGNAYIEEWPNPRLLRDVNVQAIWEGTGNVSALDVVRALAHDDGATNLFASLRARLDALPVTGNPAVARAAALARTAVARVESALSRTTTMQPDERALMTRRMTVDLAHAVTGVLLIGDAAAQVAANGGYRCLLQAVRYLRQFVFPPRDGFSAELDRTPLDYFDAIVDWAPAIPADAASVLLGAMEHQT